MGSITFNFEPSNSGPWHFEYTVDNSPPIAVTTNSSPFILPVVTAPSSQVVSLPNSLAIMAVDNLTICDDGTTPVNLDKDFHFNVNDNGNILTGTAMDLGNIQWYSSNPVGLPPLLQTAIALSSSSLIVYPTANTEYYFSYKRLKDACEAYRKVTIFVDNAQCCYANAGHLLYSESFVNGNLCQGEDLSNFSVSYEGIETLEPNANDYQYVFILTNSIGEIVTYDTSGNFDFTTLAVDTYQVHGLSYKTNNIPSDALDYLATISTDATSNDLAQIEMDKQETFEITPPDSGPWEVQYNIDGSAAITQLISSSPFVLAITDAGVYEVLSVKTQGGCTGKIGLQTKQSINIKDSPIR